MYESTNFKADLKCNVALCFEIGLSGIRQKGKRMGRAGKRRSMEWYRDAAYKDLTIRNKAVSLRLKS